MMTASRPPAGVGGGAGLDGQPDRLAAEPAPGAVLVFHHRRHGFLDAQEIQVVGQQPPRPGRRGGNNPRPRIFLASSMRYGGKNWPSLRKDRRQDGGVDRGQGCPLQARRPGWPGGRSAPVPGGRICRSAKVQNRSVKGGALKKKRCSRSARAAEAGRPPHAGEADIAGPGQGLGNIAHLAVLHPGRR